MLKSLSYNMTFPTTGRSFDEKIEFEKGFGTITGPNESGKSLVIEMIRFCLFGTAALRGVTADYKDLDAHLVFTLDGDVFKIDRTISTARIFRGKDQIAVGIRPTNEKVVQILGFGMDVFDMSCVANQDELIKLGTMRPAERKRMVDSVIGLSVLDDLAKTAGEEASALRKRAEDLSLTLKEPARPSKPNDYQPSGVLESEIVLLRGVKSQYDRIQGRLSINREAPKAPVTLISATSDELLARLDVFNERQRLERELAGLPARSAFTEERLAQEEALANRDVYLSRHTRFTLTSEEIDEHERAISIDRWWKQHDDIQAGGHHECPACHHSWPKNDKDIGPNLGPRSDGPPKFNELQIVNLRDQLVDWERTKGEYEQWEALKGTTTLNLTQIAAARAANLAAVRRDEVEQLLSKLPVQATDVAADYRERLKFEAEWKVFETKLSEYNDWLQQREADEAHAQELRDSISALPILEQLLSEVRSYEQAQDHYEKALGAYTEAQTVVESFQNEAEDWRKVRVALTTLRGKVKQHLVPSLNRVASSFLRQMTGGQRQSIVVDEDFDVLVDGQSLDTLSGSGKAVANLALRLGLGQVLTNNVLSLFIGDEIDGSMDKDRADNTTKTLRILVQNISQILLVTHKYPEADYTINLGTSSEPTEQRKSND